jgi:hypothetical protein
MVGSFNLSFKGMGEVFRKKEWDIALSLRGYQ